MAKLYFRYGAMNSGKSTALLQVAHNYEEQGMQVLVLKPGIDTKGGETITSRLGVNRKADILVTPAMNLYRLTKSKLEEENPLACVLTDESQFFTPDQIEQLLMVATKLDIPVIAYGLRTDFNMKGFPGSTRLLELAHSVEEIKTICACGKKAVCNARKIKGQFVFEGSQVAIDQENDVEYESLCAKCYFEEREKYFSKNPALHWDDRYANSGRYILYIGTNDTSYPATLYFEDGRYYVSFQSEYATYCKEPIKAAALEKAKKEVESLVSEVYSKIVKQLKKKVEFYETRLSALLSK